jgi:hypothetical protein
MFWSRTALAALIALLVPAAAASAAVDTIGSGLAGPASTAIQRTEDTALAQPRGARAAVGTSGCGPVGRRQGLLDEGQRRRTRRPRSSSRTRRQRRRAGGHPSRSSSTCRSAAPGPTRMPSRPSGPPTRCVTAGDLVGVVVGGQTPGYPQGTQYFIAQGAPGRG